MKRMAYRPLVRWTDGHVVEEKDVTPFSQRIVHAGEIAGWALLTFAVLYIGLHIVVAVFG